MKQTCLLKEKKECVDDDKIEYFTQQLEFWKILIYAVSCSFSTLKDLSEKIGNESNK